MNIREAILKAADSIEQRPELFRFSSLRAPDAGCGTPGCAFGWIAAYCGTERGGRWGLNKRMFEAMGFSFNDHGKFYERMSALATGWSSDPGRCASTLRTYADKYHPATKHTGLPASVQKILDMELEQLRAVMG